ncbi:MAG: helix-turn-helix transcriptional regulator [Proteobacteria bacterium]|nr:helix-turn-helix transcriptional regulator [Pseudomonadota bacterium]
MDRSTRGIDYQRVPRAVAVLIDEYPAGHVDPRHNHERAQLIYASAGVMSVISDQGSYVIPPQRAVWIPGGVYHEAHCRTAVSLRTLYVDESARPALPARCRVIAVPPLLRELILEATELPIEYRVDGRDNRIMELILDELCIVPDARLHVPMPQSKHLVRICSKILDDPARNDTLDELAAQAGCSRRTFTRTFRKETDMSFSSWRRHVRLLEATSRLAEGQPVTRVAFDVGYASQSAFTAMFHRVFGTTPTEYLSND